MLNHGLDDSEKLTSDKDLFRDINPSSSIIQPNVDPIPSNTDADSTDSEDAGENSLDNVVLDNYLKDNLEDDGNSSVYEDEGECYETAEVTVVDMGDDGMDVDEGETTSEMDVNEGVVADEVDPDEAVEKQDHVARSVAQQSHSELAARGQSRTGPALMMQTSWLSLPSTGRHLQLGTMTGTSKLLNGLGNSWITSTSFSRPWIPLDTALKSFHSCSPHPGINSVSSSQITIPRNFPTQGGFLPLLVPSWKSSLGLSQLFYRQ